MAVRIVNPEPDPSVVKQVVCRNCGVKLSYVPKDVKVHSYTCMGESESDRYIDCPSCNQKVILR